MEKKKRNILVLTVLLIGVVAIIGISYALWSLNLTQTGKNDIASSCFNSCIIEIYLSDYFGLRAHLIRF